MFEFLQFCQSMHDAPEINLGLLTQCTVKPVYWHRFVAKETTVFTGFPRRICKDSEGEGHKVVLCLCTILWMIDSKVTGWYFGSQHHQPSGSNWSGVYILSTIQSLSCVWLFVTPWTAGRQASLSVTNSWSSLKLMCIRLVMPSSHLSLWCPLSPALNLSQHQGLFQWVSYSHQVAKVLEFQLQHQSFQWTPRTDLL